MQPKISIIVPCWGVEKYLDRTITSILSQTMRSLEVILVDDESPDRVPEMCDAWASRDPRIKVIHKNNAGLGMACNSGLNVASGEYVAFCDSDDWVEIDSYEKMFNAAEAAGADMVMTSFKYVDMSGSPIMKPSITYEDKTYRGNEIKSIMKGMIASIPSSKTERQFQASAKVTLYKNSIIRNHSLKFVSERDIPSEDLIFNLKYLSYCNTVVTLSDKYYNYRYNPGSISHSIKSDAYTLLKKLYIYLINEVENIGLGEDGLNRVRRLFIGTCRVILSRIINSNLVLSDKNVRIDEICRDVTLKKINMVYPIREMPLKHKVFWLATVYDFRFVLKFLSRFIH